MIRSEIELLFENKRNNGKKGNPMKINLLEYTLDEKIYDICRRSGDEGTNYILRCYDYDWSDMSSHGRVPFLFRDGKFVWKVDLMTVTKEDIYNTFSEYSSENSIIEVDSCVCQMHDVDWEVELSKKEFLRQWKQKVHEWKMLSLSPADRRRFRRFLQQCPVSPMSVLQAVYREAQYTFDEFSYGFSCTKKEAISILKSLGFKTINAEREYSINGDFCEDVQTICDNVNDMLRYSRSQGKDRAIKRMSRRIFGSLSNFFGEQRDKAALEIDNTAVRLKPIKREKRGGFRAAIVAVITAGIIVILLLFLYGFHGTSALNSLPGGDAFAGSIMGFEGALLGALITGIITIITTACLIGQSYKVDYHNERLRVLPVFSVKCLNEGDFKKYKSDYKNTHYSDVETYAWDGDKPGMYVVCQNIGNGMAFQTEIHIHPSDPDYIGAGTFSTGDVVAWRHVKKSLFKTYISFKDIYGNLYSQRFRIEVNNERRSMEVVEQAPELILRTERARYIQ